MILKIHQPFTCRIIEKLPSDPSNNAFAQIDTYRVYINQLEKKAKLMAHSTFEPFEEVLAKYICTSESGEILLYEPFSRKSTKPASD